MLLTGQRPNIRPMVFYQLVGLPSATSPSCKPELQAVMREESEDKDKDKDEDMDEDKDDKHIKEIKPPFNGFTADGRTPQFCQGVYYSMRRLRQLPLCFDDQIKPMDSDDNPADYASLKLDHDQTKTWVLMPVGYRPSQQVDTQDFLSATPSDEALPVPTTDKEFVFCYEDATQCIYYTGEFVNGRREVWEKNCKWARFNHKQWYTLPTEDEDAEIDMELAHETIPDEEPITPRANKGKGRAIEEEDEGMQGDDNNMQGDSDNMQGDNNNMQGDNNNMQGVGTDEESDDTVPRPLQRLKGGRIPNAGLKACSDFSNKTRVGADELTAQYNCKRQTVLMKAGLYIASAHSDHVYNDFKTWNSIRGTRFSEEPVEGKDSIKAWTRGITKLYHKNFDGLPATKKLAMHQLLQADITVWGSRDSNSSVKGGHKALNQFSALVSLYSYKHEDIADYLMQSKAFSQVYDVKVVGLVVPISSNPMAAQMAGLFYRSNATERLLSDAKLPLEKLIDLMTTAIKAIKAGSSFDAIVFVPQLWPELFAASNMRKDTMTDGTGVPTNGEPNMDGTGETSMSARVSGSLPKKDNNIWKPKIPTTKSKKRDVITISDTESVKPAPKQKKKKIADQGPKDDNRGTVSTFWRDMQNEINGVIKAQASFKTFATDLEVAKKTLTAFPLHVPFPGYLDGGCCYTDMAMLRSGLVSGMAKRLHPTNFACPFLWPWTDKEKSYKKGTAEYKAIPIIETGEGTVGPSITITTTLDAKRNHEAYALQCGKAVPIESDHESDPENNHVSVVEQNEQPIARLPSRAPPPQ
ncbi:hypothetical protein DXG01_016655 [Tephrocybe rancida]|nr:hypothetical protein DXG01_016655 [Tephrocybe rancida]